MSRALSPTNSTHLLAVVLTHGLSSQPETLADPGSTPQRVNKLH